MTVRQSSAPDEIRAVVSVAAVPPTVSPEMWETTANELLQLMQYVCSSPHVTSNAKYAELPAKLHFNAKAADPTVNAFATLANGSDPVIMLLGGAIRFANLVSAALLALPRRRPGTAGKIRCRRLRPLLANVVCETRRRSPLRRHVNLLRNTIFTLSWPILPWLERRNRLQQAF